MGRFEEWLYRVSGHTSQRSIAAEVGVPNTSISRWVREGKAPAEQAIAIARHYRTNIWEGLIASGYVSDDELHFARDTVEAASSRQILEELIARVDAVDVEQRVEKMRPFR